MVERPLSIFEVPGSTPGFSSFSLKQHSQTGLENVAQVILCLERPLFQPVLLLFFATFDLEWKEKSSVISRQAKQCWISLRGWEQKTKLGVTDASS